MDNIQKSLYILYVGQISREGYNEITKICNSNRGDYSKVILVLGTSGGDPHAGFRIARALQHYSSDGFTLVVPQYCKSAGTLIAIGASDIAIANCG
ncbi:MAG TPA: ATP-dependent Clp protease proteolytic subunit, partial [Agitococcus sp.]|nr:ATP-dependent Clp protease proteolytic subunit [Agitococcus sp.]